MLAVADELTRTLTRTRTRTLTLTLTLTLTQTQTLALALALTLGARGQSLCARYVVHSHRRGHARLLRRLRVRRGRLVRVRVRVRLG